MQPPVLESIRSSSGVSRDASRLTRGGRLRWWRTNRGGWTFCRTRKRCPDAGGGPGAALLLHPPEHASQYLVRRTASPPGSSPPGPSPFGRGGTYGLRSRRLKARLGHTASLRTHLTPSRPFRARIKRLVVGMPASFRTYPRLPATETG